MSLQKNSPILRPRKISMARGNELTPPLPSIRFRIASMNQSFMGFDDIQSLRKFSDEVIIMKRGGKLFGKHKTKH